MKLLNIFYAIITGSLTGILWSFALGFELKTGIIYGSAVSVGLYIFIYLIIRAILNHGEVRPGEIVFVSNGILNLFLIAGIVSGLIAWVI